MSSLIPPRNTAPKIGAVIATLGMRDLQALLHSLSAQTYALHEIIVVDQSVDGDAAAQLAEWSARLPLKHVRDMQRGASRARNHGIEIATADMLIFPDDDCWYPEDFCARIIAEREHGYTMVSGCTSTGPQAGASGMARFQSVRAEIGLGNVLYTAIEFCMAVDRSTACAVRFDPRIGVGSGTAAGSDEAVDFFIRAMQVGAKAIYVPDLVAFHPDPLAGRRPDLHRRGFRYAVGRGYILRRYRLPARVVMRELLRPMAGSLLKLLFGDVFLSRYYLYVAAGKVRGLMLRLTPADSPP